MVRIAGILCLFFFFVTSSQGLSPDDYLSYSGSARSTALGGLDMLLDDDASVLLGNPAGLVNIDYFQWRMMSMKLVEDTTLTSIVVAGRPEARSNWGVALVGLNSGGYDIRNSSNQKTGTFEVKDLGVLVGYAFEFFRGFAIGFSGGYLAKSVYNIKDERVVLNSGIMWKISPGLVFSGAFKNVGAIAIGKSNADAYPINNLIGLKMDVMEGAKLMVGVEKFGSRSKLWHRR
jgi:hypothetical protein